MGTEYRENLTTHISDPTSHVPHFITSLSTMSSLLAPEKTEFNPPSNLSGWQLVAKVFIGLVIGGIIAALLFIVVSFIGNMFTTALGQQAGEFSVTNPLLPLILLFIGFISTFIGNIAVA